MAVNLPELLSLHPIAGIKVGTADAKIKSTEHDDLALFELPPESTCAAVFTRNAFCAAPVTIAKQHLATTTPRYLLINSGNANAGMGQRGLNATLSCCESVAQLTGCAAQQVLPFSTGVIGAPLPVEKIQAALPTALAALDAEGWKKAAGAIMTTDTAAKGESIQVTINNQTVTVTGIAKGAGMIRPDMATLLVFIATDAAVAASVLKTGLADAMNNSFHRITVDGDTSTNDACVLIATGQSRLPPINSTDDSAYRSLYQAISQVCQQLAQKIVRDAEGATKFITIDVEQGLTETECLDVAYTIAHSPLVKTAFFASDANWGRILAAVGRAGIDNLDIQAVKIYLGDVCIVENGGVADSYTEEQGQRIMSEAEIRIRVVLARGEVAGEDGDKGHHVRIWTSDLSHDYVRINAEYRT